MPPRPVLLVMVLTAGLSVDAVAQSLKVSPLTLKSYPMAFKANAMSFKANAMSFKANAMSFKANAMSFKAFDVTLPVVSMTAKVDNAKAKAKKEVRFRLSGDVLFDFDKANIRPEADVILADLAKKISKNFAGAPVRVEGHTDAKGEDSYNQTLSQQRAESVKRWFIDYGAILGRQIQTQGFGEKRPVAPNKNNDGTDNPQGRQENRRVEIVVERRG